MAYWGGEGVFVPPSPLWKGENNVLVRRCRSFFLCAIENTQKVPKALLLLSTPKKYFFVRVKCDFIIFPGKFFLYVLQGSGGATYGDPALMMVVKDSVRKRRVKVNSNDSYQEVEVQLICVGEGDILEENYVGG